MIESEPYDTIPTAPPAAYYEPSYAQKLVWQASQPDGGSGSNTSFFLQIEGELQVALLERSTEELVSRHEILRTTFLTHNGELMQRISPAGSFNPKINHIDISDYVNRDKITDEIIQEEHAFPFDLQTGHLVRITLIRVLKTRFIFMWSMHPIISDDHSIQILVRELFTLYNAYRQQTENPLPPLRVQYKDFAAWQKDQLQGDYLITQEKYWLNYLADSPLPVTFPVDFPENKLSLQYGSMLKFEIVPVLTAQLNNEANRNDASLFMVLLTIITVLLNRYTGEPDIMIGTYVTTRKHQELENQVGVYNNLLPVRIQINNKKKKLADVLANVKCILRNLHEYDQYPFGMLAEKLRITKGDTRPRFINVFVQSQQSLVIPDVPELDICDYSPGDIAADTNFTFNFKQSGDYIKAVIEYDSGLYKHATVQHIADNFLHVCRLMAENSNLETDTIELTGI